MGRSSQSGSCRPRSDVGGRKCVTSLLAALDREREFVDVERSVKILLKQDAVADVVDGILAGEGWVQVKVAEAVSLELDMLLTLNQLRKGEQLPMLH